MALSFFKGIVATSALKANAELLASSSKYLQFVRCRTGKHWDPKFKSLRAKKFIKVKLPTSADLNKSVDELTKEEIRAKLKERGLLPDRPWSESQIYISSTGGIFEPYVPPEGDGKVSIITAQGAKQKIEYVEKKSKSMLAVRKIRSFEEDFEFPMFLEEAQEIYINAHQAMASKDPTKLSQFFTERAYPEVAFNVGDKTMNWSFLKSIEPPRVVHVRCTDVISKENIFSQITVRFHSQQCLAVYDRFGRLIHGSESVGKDVLEYIVFEKHISNKYGKWRIHDKIIPDWMPPREPVKRTFLKSPLSSETAVDVAPQNKEVVSQSS